MKNTIWAKFYRTITSILPVSRKRRGACADCGACCQLPIKCFFLRFNKEGKSYCAVWKYRFLQCRKYPRTDKEWLTPQKCGYWFE